MPVTQLLHLGLFIFRFRKVAGNRLEKVGLRDDPLKCPVLVDHNRELERIALEEVERIENGSALMHRHRRLKRRGHIEGLVGETELENVFLAGDARDLIDGPAAHDQLPVRAVAQARQNCFLGILRIDPHHLRPRRHDRLHRPTGKGENAAHLRRLRSASWLNTSIRTEKPIAA